jgi:hypothetical protein
LKVLATRGFVWQTLKKTAPDLQNAAIVNTDITNIKGIPTPKYSK